MPILKIGSMILLAAMLLLANTDNQTMFVISGVVFGLGVGICSPTIFAWTIDLSDEAHRGRGIATMYIALEIGTGMGAFLSGLVYGNQLENLSLAYYISATMVLFGLIYLYSGAVKKTASVRRMQ